MKLKEMFFVDRSKSREESRHNDEYILGFSFEHNGQVRLKDSFHIKKGWTRNKIRMHIQAFFDRLTIAEYELDKEEEYELVIED